MTTSHIFRDQNNRLPISKIFNITSNFFMDTIVDDYALAVEGFIILFHYDNSNILVLSVGDVLPLSQVRNDVATAFIREVEWQTNQMILPFKSLCEQRKVRYCCS